jgi:hypothetical protein
VNHYVGKHMPKMAAAQMTLSSSSSPLLLPSMDVATAI